jgi:Domain of unknown function (DUF5668)/Cell wall-active antibiotics response 4TMS YvqF
MNYADSSAQNPVAQVFYRSITRLIIGLSILAAGLLWTLDNLNVLDSDPITRWWPVVVIVVGLVRLFDPAASKLASAVIALVGVGILLDVLDLWDFDPGDFIPLLIAFIGAKLVLDVFRRRNARSANAASADSIVHAFAFMSGVGRRSVSADFRGGDANAIMGGVELDLRNAQIAPGQEVVIDTFAFWGGIEVRVPDSWRVVSQVMPLMGAYEDNTTSTEATGGPVLVVRGVVVMGAIEVKN